MELYTEENMIIREHIAHHPLIVEKLTSMWDKLVLEYYDDDHTGNLDRAGYVRFHYALCKAIQRDGVTDEVMHSLCGRMPELTTIDLMLVQSLTAEGLSAVGGLTALTTLGLWGCNVTDVGLQELTTLTQLTKLWLYRCPTTKAGRDALKAAIPGLSVNDE